MDKILSALLNWLSAGSAMAWIILVAITTPIIGFVFIYVISFLQGREVSFWPLKIGNLPEKQNKLLPENPDKSENEPIVIYENYRKVRWMNILNEAKSMDIVVTYFDSWIGSYWDYLLNFYKRGGKIRIVLTNPSSDKIILAWNRFEKHSDIDEFKNKIEKTIKLFQCSLEESQSTNGEFNAYYVDFPLNYAVIRVDNEKLFFSFYEHARKIKIGAPMFLFDIKKMASLEKYCDLCNYQAFCFVSFYCTIPGKILIREVQQNERQLQNNGQNRIRKMHRPLNRQPHKSGFGHV